MEALAYIMLIGWLIATVSAVALDLKTWRGRPPIYLVGAFMYEIAGVWLALKVLL